MDLNDHLLLEVILLRILPWYVKMWPKLAHIRFKRYPSTLKRADFRHIFRVMQIALRKFIRAVSFKKCAENQAQAQV